MQFAKGSYQLRTEVLLVGVFLATLLLVCFRLAAGRLWDWDEAVYTQAAREMVRSGDWLTPVWPTEPLFDKPPLYMWLQAALFSVFGFGEFWARLPSAIAAAALASVTVAIGLAGYGSRAGLLAGAVLVSSNAFLWFGRFATLDMTFTAFLYVAIYGVIAVRRDPRWWYLVGAALGLAVMTKSGGVVLAVIAVAAFAAVDPTVRRHLRSRHIVGALALAALIVLPWHLAMIWVHGKAFIDDYLGRDIVARATDALEGHSGGWTYYGHVLATEFYPWAIILPVGLVLPFLERDRPNLIAAFLAGFVILVFGAFTLVATKLPWYVLPAYPAASVLIAGSIRRIPWERLAQNRRMAAAACFVVVVVLIVGRLVVERLGGPYSG